MLKAFAKDSVVYAVPAVFSRGLAVLLIPLYTRVLAPAEYGSLDLLLVFASLVKLTVALEVSQAVARFYAAERDPARKSAYASTSLWFTLAAYSLFALLALWQSERLAALVMGREGMERAFGIGVLYIWVSGHFYLIQNQLRWELRSVQYAIASALMAAVTAASALVLLYGFAAGLDGLLAGMTLGAAVGAAYGASRLRGVFGLRFDAGALREMLTFSAPLVPSAIAVFVSTFADRIMINLFVSVDAVGIYGVGFRVAGIVGLVMVGVQGALTPLVYTHYRDPATPATIARIFRVFVGVALCLSLSLVLFAGDVLAFIAPPAYGSAAPVIALLVPSILLAQMHVFTPGIAIAKRTHLILAITALGASANVVLNWLLIPRLGIDGAALATLLANAVAFAAYVLVSQRLYRVPHEAWRLLGALGTVLAIALVRSRVPAADAAGIALDVGAIAAAIAVVIAFGLVRRAEAHALLGALRSKLAALRPR
ncbi:N/A [soil metagenome]